MGLLIGGGRRITDLQYEDRFYYARNKSLELNHAGYGPANPYIPPLQNPTSLFGVVERHNLLVE